MKLKNNDNNCNYTKETRHCFNKPSVICNIGVMLHVIPMSLLCLSKNEVAFKIIIELVIDQNSNFDHMVILKATLFLEGHKRNMSMTFRITRNIVLRE